MSTILITGGNSGIGLATAQRFHALGWNVGIVGRRADAVDAAVRTVGARARGFVADVARVADIERLAQEAKTTYGSIDSVFVNAGLGEFRSLAATDEAYFDHVVGVNFKGAFFTIQRLAPLLTNPGTVVLNTSIADEKGFADFSAYSASKAAVRSLARTLSRELLPRGVRVNAVSPGPIDTPIFGKVGVPAEAVPQVLAGFAAQVPLGRMGRPEEVARAVEFLATDASSFVVGVELTVDGGMSQL